MTTQNTLKTVVLLAALTGLLVLVGRIIGGPGGMVLAFMFAIVMNVSAYWFSDKLALKMAGAREVGPEQAPELHRMVEQLSRSANLPMPRVYLIETDAANAFATGRDPNHAAVAATTGIMRILSRDELAGVMAHELAHIKNRDILVSTVVATVAGAISMIAQMAQWAMIFGGFGRSEEGEESGGLGSLAGTLIMIVLAPIAAMIIQMAVSRTREYGADEGGANILGDPLPLASALEKLQTMASQRPLAANPGTAHLYIVNPLTGGGLASLFSTHPPVEQRVARLRDLALRQTMRVPNLYY